MDHEWPDHYSAAVVREGFGGKLSSYTIALEAWRRGLDVTFFDAELRQYAVSDRQGHTIKFIRSRPQMTTATGVRNANNKHRAVQLLRNAGVPAPSSFLIDTSTITMAELSKVAETIGFPVVLKPVDGSMGKGVFAGIQDNDALLQRYQDLMSSVAPPSAVLEAHVAGDDYRVLVYGEEVVGVCRRVPANIVGDGHRTVQELINDKNAARRQNPFLSKGLIKPDGEVDDFLARQGQALTSVPRVGEHLRLRSAANASAGGDVYDVTTEFPRRIKEAAIAAVQAIPGLFCAGVDVLFEQDSEANQNDYTILELNAHPQIGVNMYPTHGTGQDAPRRIMEICFPESRRPSDEGSKRISLPPLRDLLWPLRTGSARSVALEPLPTHPFSARHVVRFALKERVTLRQRNRILLASRKHRTSGALRMRDDELELVAAGDHSGVQSFISSVGDILKINFNDIGTVQNWDGAVSLGFTFLEG